MPLPIKSSLKTLLGDLPFAAELYWRVRQPGRPVSAKFDLSRLAKALPIWRAEAEKARSAVVGRRSSVVIFATLRYWLEHAALLGMAFAGLGHEVTLSYLPYADWRSPLNRFDLRRQNEYTRTVLEKGRPLLTIAPLLNARPAALPAFLQAAVEENAYRDTQYTLQMENVDRASELYRLRLERDNAAAGGALSLLSEHRPEALVIPNGAVLEFGALYQTARYLGIPTVSYEFGEQRGKIWLAQNAEVMRQETDELWAARRDLPLEEAQLAQVRALFTSRQRASLWESGDKSHRFARRWQGAPSEGGAKARAALRLDTRPIVLLATNVIGDSLTLGRQVFSDSMTGWLERTVQWFAGRPDVQLVVRIHPGELIAKGPSVADVVKRALPQLPEHIHLIPAEAKVNTYDLVEIADLGLVYTTTVGMEMAMSGAPVIAVGRTHYRGKGFTLDADTWEDFFELLSKILSQPQAYRLSPEQVECAWQYAYRFFFEYPHPFPWHLLHFWKDLEDWPLSRALGAEGQEQFGKTFRYLAGETVDWQNL